MKCNQSRPGFELVSPCSFPTAITTIPRAPKLSDGEAPVILDLWGMRSTPLLLSLPRVVAPDRVLSMDQIELSCVLVLD